MKLRTRCALLLVAAVVALSTVSTPATAWDPEHIMPGMQPSDGPTMGDPDGGDGGVPQSMVGDQRRSRRMPYGLSMWRWFYELNVQVRLGIQ